MGTSSVTNPSQRITLTDRQEAVLQLIAKGLTNAEIAERLAITLDGVKWHVREILAKFDVTSREQAVDRWREQESAGRRLRNWAGGFLSAGALKWGIGVASVTGLGIAGTAGMVNTLRAGSTVEDEPPATVPPVLVDPAVNDGLTLSVRNVQADDTLTTIEISLEGRPELGRFGSPALSAPGWPILLDESGRTYRARGYGGAEGDPRYLKLTFDPLPANTSRLILTLSNAAFVAPVDEVPVGQKPPDPSSVIDGPWRVNIIELRRQPTSSTSIDATPRPFGPGSVVFDEVIQTADDTVLRGHSIGWTGEETSAAFFQPVVKTADGTLVPLTSGRWGNGPDHESMEMRFPRQSGTITLSLMVMPGHIQSDEEIANQVAAQKMTAEQEAAYRKAHTERRALTERVQASFEGQPEATWTIALP